MFVPSRAWIRSGPTHLERGKHPFCHILPRALGLGVSDNGAATQILLVEDDPHDAELTLRALKTRILSNQLTWAHDPVEALKIIFGPEGDGHGEVRCRPKLILLDMKMPKLNGLDLLRRLKSNDETKSIPVVMLTSSREERDLKECYKLGVNSYIVKPINYEAFCEVVEHLRLYWLVINQSPQN